MNYHKFRRYLGDGSTLVTYVLAIFLSNMGIHFRSAVLQDSHAHKVVVEILQVGVTVTMNTPSYAVP